MNKNIVIAIFLIAVAGGVYYWYGQRNASSGLQTFEQIPGATGPEMTPGSQDSIGKHAVTWKFDSLPEDSATGAPMTKVTVTWDGTSHDAGTYQGSCAEIDGSNGTLQDGEVSGALCWFAGAGDEIGVFAENGTFVLKHGEQQEPSAEAQGFRGNFKTLITL
jgi:hypothetical protein